MTPIIRILVDVAKPTCGAAVRRWFGGPAAASG